MKGEGVVQLSVFSVYVGHTLPSTGRQFPLPDARSTLHGDVLAVGQGHPAP